MALESADAPVAIPEASETPPAAVAPPVRERRDRLSIGAWIAIGWLVLVSGVALLAPVLPLDEPLGKSIETLRNPQVGPFESADHILGTDDNHRDILSRVAWGGRTSLLVGVGSIALGVVIGGTLGLIAGYVGGRTDAILSSMFNILLAFPQLVLALTLVSVLSPQTDLNPPEWGSRIVVMILSIGIVSIPILARITRANTLVWARREFVVAARAQGARSGRVMFREVLPNVLPAMLSIALLGVAVVIVIEGGLALFGLSVPSPEPSWGKMIADQIDKIDDGPYIWQIPAVVIFLTVLSLNYLGDVLRSRFDVRESAL